MLKRFLVLVIFAGCLMLAAACSSEKQEEKSTARDGKLQVEMQDEEGRKFLEVEQGTVYHEVQYQPTDIDWNYERSPVVVAGMQFTPPTQYIEGEASPPRVASFLYPPVEPERDSAMLAVFYFGPEQGGSIEDNIERWIAQMHYDDGRDPHSAAIQYDIKADGMTGHVLSMFGTYKQQIGGPMSGETVFKDRYRLVGVIFEAPEGNVFFKLTGPDETARVMIEPFMKMVRTARKAAQG